MKKFNSATALILCFLMLLTVFTACSKTINEDNTAESVSDENWQPGNEYYQPVDITDVELADIVNKALGDEAAAFNGDLNSLSADQISKVKQVAAVEGYVVDTDSNGNTTIKKDNVPVTEVATQSVNEVLSEAQVENLTNLTPSQYERVSKVAEDKGYTAVTDKDGDVTVIQKVTTTARATTSQTTTEKKGFFDKILGKNDDTTAATESTANINPENTTASGVTGGQNTTAPTATETTKKHTTAKQTTTKPIVTGKPATDAPYQPSSIVNNPLSVVTSKVTNSGKNAYGDSSNCIFVAVASTGDGSVSVGSTSVDASGAKKDYSSGLIVKYNNNGKKEWSHTLSSDNLISFEDVAVLSNGSIIAVGTTMATTLASDSGYKCKGTVEGIVCKYSKSGKLEWTKIIGGSQSDMIYAVSPTSDGGMVIGGKTNSPDADFKNVGSSTVKAFVSKLDANGNISWSKALSGTKHCAVQDVVQGSDGSIYAAIESICKDGDFASVEGSQNGRRYTALWKLSPAGGSAWVKGIWEEGTVSLNSLCAGIDGGVVLAGNYATSASGNQGAFKGIYNGGQPGTSDGAVIKYSAAGNREWVLPLIGFQSDFITGITPINGGYALSGYTTSTNRDFAFNNKGEYDSFVYIVSAGGGKQCASSFAGSGSDRAMGICSSGSTVYLCGSSASSDADFAGIEATGTPDRTAAFLFRFDLTQS